MQITIDPTTARKITACLEVLDTDYESLEDLVNFMLRDLIDNGAMHGFADDDEQLEARIEDILTC